MHFTYIQLYTDLKNSLEDMAALADTDNLELTTLFLENISMAYSLRAHAVRCRLSGNIAEAQSFEAVSERYLTYVRNNVTALGLGEE